MVGRRGGRGQSRGGAFADEDAFELGKAVKMWKTSLPPGVVVSIASWTGW
jgi:hypothetical protein